MCSSDLDLLAATEAKAAKARAAAAQKVKEQGGYEMDLEPAAQEPVKFAKAEELPTHIDVDGVQRPTTDSTGAPIHTTEEGVKNFWKGFGDSKMVDSEGRPIVVYRGSIGGEEVREGALEGKAREGYATFASSSPHVAATYAQPDAFELQHPPVAGAIAPYYVNAKKIIEFPVKDGSFDKFEFDRRAKMLPPGTVLVARNARDVGPRASLKTDPDKIGRAHV